MRAAIIVGSSIYEDEQIADLKYAHIDAGLIAECLISRCGVAKENTYLIESSGQANGRLPRRSELIRILSKGASISAHQSIETLFFFFSGHGIHSIQSNKDYLIMSDTVYSAIETTALDFDFVESCLRNWKAERTVIILDACRSYYEQSKSSQSLSEAQAIQVNSLEGMIVLRSCSLGERSYELERQGCGLFTSSLLAALGDHGKCVTYYELNSFLMNDVPRLCHEHKKPIQHPLMRVEPIDTQGARIVSIQQALAWQRERIIGEEIRTEIIEVNQADGPWSDYIGIDFGTSSSLVNVLSMKSSQPTLVEIGRSKHVPTVISINSDFSYLVGRAAKEKGPANKKNTYAFFKTLLGSEGQINLNGITITYEQAAGLIIKSLKQSASEITGHSSLRVYASCPVNFSTAQQNGLAEAFLQAGFKDLRFVPEPCAAALTLSLTHFPRNEAITAVIVDLGGGTLDVAAVSVGDRVVETLSVDGDRSIGGRDYDRILANFFRSKLISAGAEEKDLDNEFLASEAERYKKLLSQNFEAPILLRVKEDSSGSEEVLGFILNRDKAEMLFDEQDRRVISVIKRLIASIPPYEKVGAVVLAGMGAKVFSLRQKIEKLFEGIEIIDQYQENAVAIGLGIYLRTLVRVEGFKEPWLLLNSSGKEFSISCSSYSVIETSNFIKNIYKARIAEERLQNRDFLVLLGNDTTIPSRKECNVEFSGESDLFEVGLFERFPADVSRTLVSNLVIRGRPEGLKIEIDVDSYGTMSVGFIGNDMEYYFQINHFYRAKHGYVRGVDELSKRAWWVEAPNLLKIFKD